MTEVGIKFVLVWLQGGWSPLFHCFFVLWSQLKFKIHNFYLYLFVYFFCIIIYDYWTCGYPIKRKKVPGIPYNIIATSWHMPWLNHWQVMLSFCFIYSHVLPVNHRYIQRIVRATNPQSMNVGAWCENCGQFPLHKVSSIRSHSHATMNQHLHCSIEGKRETKVHPWCTHCNYCRWWKGTSQAK